MTLPTTVAIGMMHDYDDVVEVTTNIIIENTDDLTSLPAWFPHLTWVWSPGTRRSTMTWH